MVLLLRDDDIRSLLTMKDCIDALQSVYEEMGKGEAIAIPRRDLYLPAPGNRAYLFKTMEGASPSSDAVAQRIDLVLQEWRAVDGVLRKLALPNPDGLYTALVFLYGVKEGRLLAIMQQGELGRLRVAGTIGLGIRYLARKDAEVGGLYGSGWQAGGIIKALAATRPLKRIKLYSPNPHHRNSFAEWASRELGIDVTSMEEPEGAAKGCDIIACATNSREPVCLGAWVGEGAHLTCVEPWEFDDSAWIRCSVRVFSTRSEGYASYCLGDPMSIPEFASGRSEASIDEYYGRYSGVLLSDVILGRVPGRKRDGELTMMCKGMGSGLEFLAIAKRAYELAVKEGLGREIPDEWFFQSSKP